MKEILDIVVWSGAAYILFILLRGMNEQQIKKHDNLLKRREEKLGEKND